MPSLAFSSWPILILLLIKFLKKFLLISPNQLFNMLLFKQTPDRIKDSEQHWKEKWVHGWWHVMCVLKRWHWQQSSRRENKIKSVLVSEWVTEITPNISQYHAHTLSIVWALIHELFKQQWGQSLKAVRLIVYLSQNQSCHSAGIKLITCSFTSIRLMEEKRDGLWFLV